MATLRRPVGRPRDTDGDDTRRAILASARDCFAAKGYAATSNRDIAERAGITASGIHHHFGRKNDLMLAVYEQTASEIAESWESSLEGADGLRARADAVLDSIHAALARDPAAAAFIFVARQEATRHAELAEIGTGDHLFFELTEEIARRAVADGEIRADQADAIATTLLTLAAGLMTLGTDIDIDRHRAATDFSKDLFRSQLSG